MKKGLIVVTFQQIIVFVRIRLIYIHLIIISPCENEKIQVSTTPIEKSYNLPENIKEFEVNISLDCKENYKFIRIIATPISNKALLYLSLTQRNIYP